LPEADFGLTFANLFDTMIAARILDARQRVGQPLEAEFGIKLDKRYQRADWGQRPLPALLLDYARMDTHYLIDLRHRLKSELEQRGRWQLAVEDFQRLCQINQRVILTESEPDFSVNGSKDLHPQQRAVLYELSKYRDRIARLQDRPLFKIIGNKTLLEIAQTCPDRLDDLAKLQGMTPRQIQRHGKQLLQAVERGLKAEPIQPKRPNRPDDRMLSRLDSIRDWRKEVAEKMGVESEWCCRDLMAEIAERNPKNTEELRPLMQSTPWRLENFGVQIVNTLRKIKSPS
jgi:ribonuclease D